VADIGTGGVNHHKFEANAHHVGGQRDAVGKKDLARTAGAEEAADRAGRETLEDQLNLGETGREAATHTGSTQNLAAQARKMSATRTAMEHGNVKPGDVDPGVELPKEPLAEQPQKGVPTEEPKGEPADPGKPAEPPTGPPGEVPPSQPGMSKTDYANKAKAAEDDAKQANMIFQQMAADRQKWMMEMWKIWQDTQNKIFEILQQVALNRAKVSSAMAEKWAAVLGGYAG